MKKGSLYIIRNTINDKVYVGQTTMSIQERFKSHLKPSVQKQRRTYKLYNAMRKYGSDNFYIEMLKDNIPVEYLDKLEIEFIEKYDSYYNGYNSTKGGDGRVINKEYDEKDIIERYLKGESSTSIAKSYNVHGATIQRLLKKHGIELRQNGNKSDSFNLEEIIELTKTNTYKQIGEIYNVDTKTIQRFLRKNGFRQRKVYNLNKV